ncbi:uncharacterized protein LOC110842880 isoform X2 [Folsomia candida]|uniref:uncharacterized protein LOC110842880 isoform X2 n=1 Tax=Folsomia candida TaxID=158441 RepID=UPI0016052138|nr:uncharacterized protein LOC110842880 isoform X2 [Folsomia candida]
MLKFLTEEFHKLKTQSLNEDDQQFENKAQVDHEIQSGEPYGFPGENNDHDSGTESDDESGETNCFPGDNNVMEHGEENDWGERGLYPLPRRGSLHCNEEGPGAGEMMMMIGGGGGGGRDSAGSQFDPGYNNIDSALPSDSDHAYDHHSSEEELEVINSSSYDDVDDEVNLPDGDDLLEENARNRGSSGSENCKRKWSQMAANRLSVESTSSSDDEVQGLLRPLSTPVEFRTSPPVDAHKPSEWTQGSKLRSQSPPPKLFLFSGPSPPIVTSTTDEPVILAATSTAMHTAPPISSNVVSSSLSCSLGAVNMAERSHGVFRGIRKFNPDIVSPYSIISSTNNATSSNGIAREGGGAFQERSDGISRSHLYTTISNSNETPSSNFINLMTAANITNSTFTSSSTGAFGRVVRSGGAKESARKRHHRHHNPRHIQRPWLDFEKMIDFEKMQQLRTRSVTTWRSGGELSLYCS